MLRMENSNVNFSGVSTVEEITVDNNNLIKEGQGLRYDAKIVIKYHTFANKSN